MSYRSAFLGRISVTMPPSGSPLPACPSRNARTSRLACSRKALRLLSRSRRVGYVWGRPQSVHDVRFEAGLLLVHARVPPGGKGNVIAGQDWVSISLGTP